MGRIMEILKKTLILFLILLIILYGYIMYLTLSHPVYYNNHIIKYSSLYDIDPYLVLAIINIESGFNPKAESNKGAKGLMQIVPDTGSWISGKLSVENYKDDLLFDMETNIKFGTWYIKYLYGVFNSRDLVLASYNGGMGNVSRWLSDSRYSKDGKTLDIIPFTETRNYVEKVNKNYKRYKLLYKDLEYKDNEISIWRKAYLNSRYIIKKFLYLN